MAVGAHSARRWYWRPADLKNNLGRVGLGVAIAALVGGLPLEIMLPMAASLALLIGMLIAPVVGLHTLLIAVPFSPTLGSEDGDFSITIVEPLACVVLAIWFARGLASQEIRIPRSALLTALFGFICVLFVAATGATSLGLAYKETLKWILLTLAFVFTSVQVRGERAIRMLLTVLFCAGSAQALWGVFQFVTGWGPPAFAIGPFMRAHGNFSQPNPFAGYLGTIFPLALALSAAPGPSTFRSLAALTVLCTGLRILLSLSRGAWLGLLIACTGMALLWGPNVRRLVIPSIGAVLIVVLLAVLGALPPALGDRVTAVTSNFGIFDARGVEPTPENFALVERMAHWQAGWEMFVDHPIRGVGPGNYPAVYEQYSLPGWREALGHAHNYYLNMAAEAGVLGLVALLVTLALAYRALLQRLLRAADPFSRALAIGLLASLTVFCTHNMFDNLLVHGVGIQVGMLLGLIGGISSR